MEFVGEQVSYAPRVTFIILGSLEIVVGVLGNLLLLCVLVTGRLLDRRHHHNLFIANLALADLVTLGYWMTFFVLDLILGYHPVANNAHCVANGFIASICVLVSMLSLVNISLNRYLHVCHNRLYRRVFNRTRTVLLCLLTWVIAGVATTPPLFGVGPYYYKKTTHTCTFSGHPYAKTVAVVFTVSSALSIGYFNFAIFRFWRLAKMSMTDGVPGQSNRIFRATRICCRDEQSENENMRIQNSPELEGQNGNEEVPVVIEAHTDDSKATVSSLRTTEETNSEEDSCSDEESTNHKESENQETTDLTESNDPRECIASKTDDDGCDQSKAKRAGDEKICLPQRSSHHVKPAETETPPTNPRPTKRSTSKSQTYQRELARRRQIRQAREQAFVRSLLVISVLMLLCFLPFGISRIVEARHTLSPELGISIYMLLFFNNSVNWIVYGVMNRSFRHEYAKLIKRFMCAACCNSCKQ